MRFVELFAGIGGFSLGFERAGMECVGHVEIDPYAQKVLLKHWPDVPLLPDVTKVNGDEFGEVNVLAAGFPCQDLSVAGKQEGIHGKRSGLYDEIIRIARVCRPKYIVLENVAALLTGANGEWFAYVVSRLAQIGMSVEWQVIPARAFGFPHLRERVFIVAHTELRRPQGRNKYTTEQPCENVPEGGFDGCETENKSRNTGICNGVSQKLDGGLNGKQEKSRPNKVLSEVRENIYKKSFLNWAIRGQGNISEKKILWEKVSNISTIQGQPYPQNNLYGEGAEIQEAGMSGVWGDEEASHSSHGQKYKEQQYQQLTDIMRYLSQQGSCNSNGFRAEEVPHRNHRIRVLGNALIPQIAEYIGNQIQEVENDSQEYNGKL